MHEYTVHTVLPYNKYVNAFFYIIVGYANLPSDFYKDIVI